MQNGNTAHHSGNSSITVHMEQSRRAFERRTVLNEASSHGRHGERDARTKLTGPHDSSEVVRFHSRIKDSTHALRLSKLLINLRG